MLVSELSSRRHTTSSSNPKLDDLVLLERLFFWLIAGSDYLLVQICSCITLSIHEIAYVSFPAMPFSYPPFVAKNITGMA